MKVYLTVKEFSKLSGIEVSTLRYWDDAGIFTPAKCDPDSGNRYLPQQIIAVNLIAVLSGLNLPKKDIAAIENERTPESIIDLMDRQADELESQIRSLRERYEILHTRRNLIKIGLDAEPSLIAVCDLPERAFVLGPTVEPKEDAGLYGPFMDFCMRAQGIRVNLNFPIGARHDSMESFLRTPGKPQNFMSLDASGSGKRPAGKYLVAYHRGFYGEFGDTALRMQAFADENGWQCTGPVYTLYLHDEICLRDTSQYLSELSVAVTR